MLLGARKQLQIKVIGLEQTVRGLLSRFGLKVGDVSRGKLPARIRELAAGHVMLEKIVEPLSAAREAMWREFAKLHREMLMIVKEDHVCRRLITVPGVGALVSLTYRATGGGGRPWAVREVQVGRRLLRPHPDAIPIGRNGRHRRDYPRRGCVPTHGSACVANALLTRAHRFSTLKRWALDVAKRRGMRRAKVAPTRKLATVLHRMWADGTEFAWARIRRLRRHSPLEA